mgnify:CR=1 FL=1
MNWFDILKILGTKSGFEQLDFDNIVEEEEDNCKRRWKELCMKAEALSKSLQKREELIGVKQPQRDFTAFFDADEIGQAGQNDMLQVHYSFDDSVPEEVYCKVLEMLDDGRSGNEPMGEYLLTVFKKEAGTHKGLLLIISNYPVAKSIATVGYYHKRKDKYPEHIRILEGGFP